MLDLTNWRSLVRSGASDRETMKLGGWSTAALITRYDEKDAVRSLPPAAVPVLVATETDAGRAPAHHERFSVTTKERERAELKALIKEALAEVLADREREASKPQAKPRAGLLTLEEVAAVCHVSPETVRHWIWEGRLTAYKPGRAPLVKEAELLAFVEANETTKKRAARVPGR
jgi:excisionase family DNA binding protein